MEQLVAKVPFMLTNGNHERDFPSSGDRYNSNDNIDSGALNNSSAPEDRVVRLRTGWQILSGLADPYAWLLCPLLCQSA